MQRSVQCAVAIASYITVQRSVEMIAHLLHNGMLFGHATWFP